MKINETDLTPILKKCRALVSHFKSSSTAAEKLRNMQQMGATELKLKKDVSTRWNSCLLVLERLNHSQQQFLLCHMHPRA
ncbi:hypothetical protein PR048_019650 [Dryococelus australis]|uniref:Uncharacterized protein n=1 Tax=Dryococelus australis TaxID=614101 RepID=A0ABQ9H425_9NEOP|nr:hypothetical protein PR048_019650 [Dryococelus australis]